jgi:hypothetical protein
MSFTCDCVLEIGGGNAADRRAAASLILAAECIDESGAARHEGSSSLDLRFKSLDGLPEDELAAIAPHFPELVLALVYFSRDGEFCGYARSGAAGEAAESEDLDAGALETLDSDYDGDGIAFARAAFGL